MSPSSTSSSAAIAARRSRGRIGVVALLVAVALVLGVAPALAQDATASAGSVLSVDMSTQTPKIVVRSATTPSNPSIVVNGEPAKVVSVTSSGQAPIPTDGILVIDNSSTSGTRLDAIKGAALAYINGMKSGERLAIVTAAGVPRLDVALTTDKALLGSAVGKLVPSGGAAVFDSVTTAARILGDQGVPLRSVTVIAASADAGAKTAASVARADAIDNDVAVNMIVLNSDDFSASAASTYQQIVKETAGSYGATDDPSKLLAVASAMSDSTRSLSTITIETNQAAAGGNVVVDLGQGPITVGFVPSALTTGASLRNTVEISDSGLAFLKGSRGMTIALVLGALAATLGAFALGSVLVKEKDGLQSVLQPYSEQTADAEGAGLQGSAIFQRAVELTSNIAESQGLLVKAEQKLEQANLPLRAAEALTFYVGIVIASGLVGFLLGRSLLFLLIFLALGAMVPVAVVNFLGKRRRKKFMMQLPDTLSLLAGTLKAGFSFMQGVEAVSHEVEEPMGSELRRVVTEAQLGRPLEEALDASAERMNSADFAWAVIAVRIQREVGGNLAELLMTVAETMTARQRLRGEVAALTAEGRISAIVLGILPVGLGAVLFVLNPEYMNVLLNDGLGRIMLGIACTSALIGFAWMKKIINIDI